jgi:hypothetical protein
MTEPYGPKNRSPKAKDVDDFHKYDDVNKGDLAHHHTIGSGQGQVASGKHKHRGGSDGELLLEGTIFSGVRTVYSSAILKQVLDALVELGAVDTTTP